MGQLPLHRCVYALLCWCLALLSGGTMVKIIAPEIARLPQALPQILYIGSHKAELRPAVMLVDGLAVVATHSVDLGLAHARQCRFDYVIFDQRDPDLASKHIAPLVMGLGYAAKMVVISQLGNLSAYLKVPRLAAVLSAPIRPPHLLRALGLSASRDVGLSSPTLELRSAS